MVLFVVKHLMRDRKKKEASEREMNIEWNNGPTGSRRKLHFIRKINIQTNHTVPNADAVCVFTRHMSYEISASNCLFSIHEWTNEKKNRIETDTTSHHIATHFTFSNFIVVSFAPSISSHSHSLRPPNAAAR